MPEINSFMFFAGSSHDSLAKELAENLEKSLGKIHVEPFPDGEIGVEILENVRGRDVFVLQSIARNPNRYLVELLIIIDALKRASAKSIAAIIPYYGYARQDRKDRGREPITAKLVANLLETAGATRALTMDLHTEQIQGFFDIPVDNLYALPVLVHAIQKEKLKNLVVVSPDVGSNKMARRYAEELHAEIAFVDKRRKSATDVEFSALIGEVEGKDVVIVDDICSTGGTLRLAAKTCKKHGAKRVIAAVSHSLIDERANLEGIDKMFKTNSIPVKKEHPNCEVVSIAPFLAQATHCILSGESLSSLYR